MSKAVLENARWEELVFRLSKRLMFTPSCGLYMYHMRNNQLKFQLSGIADSLAKCFPYLKYYFLDIIDEPRPPTLLLPAPYSPAEHLELATENLKSPQGRVCFSKSKAVQKLIAACEEYNTAVSSIKSSIIGTRPSIRYPESCSEIVDKYALESLQNRESTVAQVGAAVLSLAARSRNGAYRKGEGAEFTLSTQGLDTLVNCSLGGNPVSPTLLGIEEGDIVNEAYEVSSITGTTFLVNSTVSSINLIESRAYPVESSAAKLQSAIVRLKPINVKPINSAADFKALSQEAYNRIRFIDTTKSPAVSFMGLSNSEETTNFINTLPSPPKFTKAQRDFSIRTLNMVRAKGYELAEFQLKTHRISDALRLQNVSRSTKSISEESSKLLRHTMVNMKRRL